MLHRPRVLIIALLLTACGAGESSGPEPGEWTFNGTWRGGFVQEGASLSAVLSLIEQDSVLTGSGTISGSGVECGVTIDGSRNGEQVAFDITCAPYAPIHYRGSRTGATKIVGQVFGSGLPRSDMNLIKQ